MQTHTCKSCGTSFSGNYCNQCGEKVIRQEDRKLKHFLGEFINAITFADNKLFRTVKTILIAPGRLSADFVEGKRKKYMKPISIFFLANLIYFLFPVFNTFNTNLHLQMNAFPFLHSDLATEMVNSRLEESGETLESFSLRYDSKSTELSKLLLILISLFQAMFFWMIHSRNSKRFFSDHIIVSLELMSFIILFCIQVLGLAFLLIASINSSFISELVTSGVMFSLILYYLYRVEFTFYSTGGIRAFANAMLGSIAFSLFIFIYRSLLFFITFWSL
ncbi:MAG: DUF3667 domain-containing protein [Ekhidna sp.]|uniref:DUF3667 domain-containing protein n=1 Tax=Ekhidna sp. TaxID=2608089 RepID=UPI0032EDD1C7